MKYVAIETLVLLTQLVYVILVLMFPFITIWALNTLFALNIPYTFWTWLAMFIVNSIVASGVTRK